MNQQIIFKSFQEFINEKSEPTQKVRIFCDLDGVLVDFDRGFQEIPENYNKFTPKDYEEKNGKNSIWKLIEKYGSDYWVNLPWKSDGRELWDYIKRYNPIILSSPSLSQSSIEGKTRWVANNLDITDDPVTDPADYSPGDKLILYKDKFKFAESSSDILIDDTEKKLTDWTEAGGTGILHTDATETIRLIEEILTSQIKL